MAVLNFVFDFIVNAFSLMRACYPFGTDFLSLFDILVGLAMCWLILEVFFFVDDDD